MCDSDCYDNDTETCACCNHVVDSWEMFNDTVCDRCNQECEDE